MPRPWLNIAEQGLLVVLSAFLLLPNALSSIALISLLAIGIFKNRRSILSEKDWWWLALPVIALLIAWATGGFEANGWPELQLWATWIAALLYFRCSSFVPWFFKSFIWLQAISAALFLLWVIWLEVPAENYAQSLRDSIGSTFGTHPTYLSAIWLWTAILTFLMHPKFKPMYRVLSFVLIVAGFFASGKMPLLAFAVVAAFTLFRMIQKPQTRWITLGVFIVGFVSALLFHPVAQSRISELQSINLTYEKGQWLSSTELRLGVWKCSWQSASENWLFGVGLGNTRQTLEACYESFDQPQFFSTEFNTHQQFIHFLLAGGITALLLWLFFWVKLFQTAWQSGRSALFAFLLYAVLILQTENYLSRQDGMMFWSFMLAGLFFLPQSQPQSDQKPLAT